MKRPLALFLALLMTLSLAACGGKTSKVSIKNYEETFLHSFDKDWHFAVAESDGGYTFYFSDELYGSFPLTVEGTADKKQMIKQATVTFVGVPANYFQEATSMSILQDLSDYMNIPMNRLATDIVIVSAPCFTLDSAKTQSAVELTLSAINSPQTQDGWTYTMVHTEKTLTIASEYTE